METLLKVDNICKNFDDFSLNQVSFSLEKGYIMGLVGANGAGKTTTLKAILGAIHLDSGHIDTINKSQIGFILGENAYYENLTITQMAKIVSKFYDNWDDKIFTTYLNQFELNPKKKIENLSKGMKQKFMLACALSHDAKLFILDEPTSGIDPVSRSELLEILQEIISDGERSILFSSHITSDIEKIGDFITFIHKGNLVLSSTKDDLLNNYQLVKGPLKIMEQLREEGLIIHSMTNAFGFTALTKKGSIIKNRYSGNVLIENTTIDDMMVHIARGKQ